MLAKNRAWYLMARSLSKEASETEKAELQSLLQQNEHTQQQYAMLHELWTPSLSLDTQSGQKFEDVLRKARQLETETDTDIVKKPFILRRATWVAAASLIAAMVIGFLYFQQNAGSSIVTNTILYTDSISTSKGNRSQLILPDGSRVWLNSGSRLLYHNFKGKTREVQLVGEAYFDVVKMPDRPFIVHAEGVNIKVLGTVFNVRCYPGESNIETTLLHGAVAVKHKNDPGKQAILLAPNQKLTISKEFLQAKRPEEPFHKPYEIKNLDTTVQPAHLQETAWVYNRLEFKNIDFKTLAVKMERWYNVSISFKDNNVQQLRFVGSFEKETVEEALHALQSVADFEFDIKDRGIDIRSAK
jgi:transmembrane sensor